MDALRLDDGAALERARWCWRNGNQAPEPLTPFAARAARGSSTIRGAAKRRRRSSDLAASGGDVLLVGTGLTMVDAGAVARRGRAPRADRRLVAARADPARPCRLRPRAGRGRRGSARRCAGAVALAAAARARKSAGAQRSMRCGRIASAMWQSLDGGAAPLPAPCAALVGRPPPPDRAGGRRADARAGRRGAAGDRRRPDRRGSSEADDGLDVEIRRRGGAQRRSSDSFAYVFNCTGPLGSDRADPGSAAARPARERAASKPDPLGIGLDVDEHSRAAGPGRLWALGPMTKGRYWEIIAVPDIRGQAAAVADDIARSLGDERVRSWRAGRRRPGRIRAQGAVPKEVGEAVRTLIRWAGDDPDREGLLDTPRRVARAWREYARGYAEDPARPSQPDLRGGRRL